MWRRVLCIHLLFRLFILSRSSFMSCMLITTLLRPLRIPQQQRGHQSQQRPLSFFPFSLSLMSAASFLRVRPLVIELSDLYKRQTDRRMKRDSVRTKRNTQIYLYTNKKKNRHLFSLCVRDVINILEFLFCLAGQNNRHLYFWSFPWWNDCKKEKEPKKKKRTRNSR